MRKILASATVAVLLAATLAGCSNSNENASSSPNASPIASPSASPDGETAPEGDFRIALDQTAFTLKQWKTEGTHRSSVNGKLLMSGKPVVDAVIHVGTNKRDIVTGADGGFDFLLDQSLLSATEIHVVSTDKAKVDGKPLSATSAEKGKAASALVNVYYPIQVLSVADSAKQAGMVEVKARLIADKTASVAFFQEDKFRIAGVVKDADGRPVQGAVVWIDRDNGEGFAKSFATDESGHYEMYYLPEDDEETNLSVTLGGVKYTLPDNRVFNFPEDTSLRIDITLPKEGTVITDKPPTLVSVTEPGALYMGVLAGLDLPQDIEYKLTIPDAKGNFKVTLPKDVWEQHPTFFEAEMKKFLTEELGAGSEVKSSFIDMANSAPRGIKGEIQG
ncbi:carboxypeptidase-like regulatory domain-containing protein [Cohnella soli]|uniref:Carboxypeptidase-like regulatory domain-containing protein n=1 Tax=Cohnella soli TaxID=425005 RepID=A0ABW0HUE9_9BACL